MFLISDCRICYLHLLTACHDWIFEAVWPLRVVSYIILYTSLYVSGTISLSISRRKQISTRHFSCAKHTSLVSHNILCFSMHNIKLGLFLRTLIKFREFYIQFSYFLSIRSVDTGEHHTVCMSCIYISKKNRPVFKNIYVNTLLKDIPQRISFSSNY